MRLEDGRRLAAGAFIVFGASLGRAVRHLGQDLRNAWRVLLAPPAAPRRPLTPEQFEAHLRLYADAVAQAPFSRSRLVGLVAD